MRKITLCAIIILISCTVSAQINFEIVYSAPKGCVLHDIAFADSNNGFVVGQKGLILKTVNGGNTWDSINSGIAENLFSVGLASRSTIFACGDHGCIIKSANAGKTWKALSSGISGYLNIIRPSSGDTVWAFGQSG